MFFLKKNIKHVLNPTIMLNSLINFTKERIIWENWVWFLCGTNLGS